MKYSWDDDDNDAPYKPPAAVLPQSSLAPLQSLQTRSASNVASDDDGSSGGSDGTPPPWIWRPPLGVGGVENPAARTPPVTPPVPPKPTGPTKPTERFPAGQRPPQTDPKSTWNDDWWDGKSPYLGGWLVNEANNPIAADTSARQLTRTLAGDGHDVKADGINRLIIDGRPYRVEAAPQNPTWTPTTKPGEAPYTPGDVPFDDLDGYSFDQMVEKLRTPQDDMLDSLVGGILANPESLNPQMVETLKAKSADELAGIATAQQAELGRFGWLTGNQDSNWLQSEILANKRGRDQSLIGSNRDIDIRAAETNLADRRAAAELGTSYTAEKRARTALAADTSLRAATVRGDRLALREAVKQKAAELQLDSDELMQQYVVAQMEDLTKRYGIQVGADIDIARLSVQSQQFKEDLAFKLTELGIEWEKWRGENRNK